MAGPAGLPYAGPVHVDINVTNACNLRCAHCHSASGQALDDELTTDELLDAIEQLHRAGTMSVAFAGGEPFTRRNLIPVLEHAVALGGWKVSVITNGMFLTDRMVAALAERCPGVDVNVSLDGSTSDRYAQLRRQHGGSTTRADLVFARVTDGIRRAAEALVVSVNMTIAAVTVGDVLPTYRLARALGASSFVGIKFFPGGYGRDDRQRLELPFGVWANAFARLSAMRITGELPGAQISVPSAWEFYLPLLAAGIDIEAAETAWGYRSPLRQPAYRRRATAADPAGIAELCMSSDGVVYPSVLMAGAPELACGSLREQDGAALWTGAPLLHRLRSRVPCATAPCRQCPIGDVCAGGSRARAYLDTGDLEGPDPACPLVAAAYA